MTKGREPPMVTGAKTKPCYGCTKRHPKCHAGCKDYETMRQEIAEYRQQTAAQEPAKYATDARNRLASKKDRTKGVPRYK